MRYLLFHNSDDARARSSEIAHEVSAGDSAGGVTQFWFAVVVHPTSGKAALEVIDSDESMLTSEERVALVDRREMNDGGWFQERVM